MGKVKGRRVERSHMCHTFLDDGPTQNVSPLLDGNADFIGESTFLTRRIVRRDGEVVGVA